MKQVRPLSIGSVWTKQAKKMPEPKNPFDTVFVGSAAFKAAGKGFRSRTLDGSRAKFRSAGSGTF